MTNQARNVHNVILVLSLGRFVASREWKKGDVCDLMVRYTSSGRFQVKNVRVERLGERPFD